QCRPISRRGEMVDLVDERLGAALSNVAEPTGPNGRRGADDSAPQTAVIMVGRGSHDPCAQADMRLLSEVVSRRNPDAVFQTAFYAMAEPKLPEVIDQVVGMNRFDRIVVQPHLLFMGRLYEAIGRQVEQAQHRHPGVEFVVGDYLGPVDGVARAIAGRAGICIR
ncbi:MAG: CbiX/SirB N-terminal domain-containing protein, partial [Planctomycetota bacterium]